MRRLLNEHTGTVHKSRRETTSDEAVCGALQHVPQRQVTPIPGEGTGAERKTGTEKKKTETKKTETEKRGVQENVERCGRCFEEAGGY